MEPGLRVLLYYWFRVWTHGGESGAPVGYVEIHKSAMSLLYKTKLPDEVLQMLRDESYELDTIKAYETGVKEAPEELPVTVLEQIDGKLTTLSVAPGVCLRACSVV